ncbi:MAG: hypothetical protein JO358_16440, partial [Alphaproteobacteria bacterium]|nr:hypothetical protein [Alphaproteobacteria bacterium]
ADFGWLRLTGRLAWLAWGSAHIHFLQPRGGGNRLAVVVFNLSAWRPVDHWPGFVTDRDLYWVETLIDLMSDSLQDG